MIDRKIVEHLADLSRIRLSDGEADALAGELGGILDYVGALQKVDTSGIPREGVPGILRNAYRPDDTKPFSDPGAIVEEAPHHERGYFAVKKVIEYDA